MLLELEYSFVDVRIAASKIVLRSLSPRVPMAIRGEEPSEDELDWLKYGREIFKESPKVLDETSKSLIALGSSLLTIYTSALVLLKFNERLDFSSTDFVLISIPIIFWLLSIGSNAYVYFPDRYKFNINSPTDILETTRDICKKKNTRLKIGAVFFVSALIFSSFSIVWLGTQKVPSIDLGMHNQTVQFVISKDKLPVMQNMSISFEGGSQRTVPLLLLNKMNRTYLIEIPDGKKVEFDKDLVEGIIYSDSVQKD